jgi:hypothetical protein
MQYSSEYDEKPSSLSSGAVPNGAGSQGFFPALAAILYNTGAIL